MGPPQPRIATLVLCRPGGEVLGSLPPFEADVPWWQDAEALVRWVGERHRVRVTILRLLDAELPSPPGGAVSYLAEVDPQQAMRLPLAPWAGTLQPDPRRLPYAEPGGPDRDLAWAAAVLAAHGTPQRGAAQQVRTWNLSSLWRIPIEEGNVWLKSVPPFFAHEGAVLAALQEAPVPRLLAHDGGRVLMPEIPGEDLYAAELPTLLTLVSMLVALQVQWVDRGPELLSLGLPDWRTSALSDLIESVVRRTSAELTAEDRRTLDDFVTGLPRRFAALDGCGIPDTLVHGDFAPGNARGTHSNAAGTPDDLVLLDWGDCGLGHPLLDQAAFTDRIAPGLVPEVRAHWDRSWLRAVRGSDPRRAGELLAPVAAARQAVIYQNFLDHIEPSEYPYHRDDPALWLKRTADLAKEG